MARHALSLFALCSKKANPRTPGFYWPSVVHVQALLDFGGVSIDWGQAREAALAASEPQVAEWLAEQQRARADAVVALQAG